MAKRLLRCRLSRAALPPYAPVTGRRNRIADPTGCAWPEVLASGEKSSKAHLLALGFRVLKSIWLQTDKSLEKRTFLPVSLGCRCASFARSGGASRRRRTVKSSRGPISVSSTRGTCDIQQPRMWDTSRSMALSRSAQSAPWRQVIMKLLESGTLFCSPCSGPGAASSL